MSALSSLGNEPWVFTRRRNSPLSRSMTLVVRMFFHCCFGKRYIVKSSSPASSRLFTTPGQLHHEAAVGKLDGDQLGRLHRGSGGGSRRTDTPETFHNTGCVIHRYSSGYRLDSWPGARWPDWNFVGGAPASPEDIVPPLL